MKKTENIDRNLACKIIGNIVQKDIIDRYGFNFGEAEVDIDRGYFMIEAPRHSTIDVECSDIIDWVCTFSISKIFAFPDKTISLEDCELDCDFYDALKAAIILKVRGLVSKFDADTRFQRLREVYGYDSSVDGETLMSWVKEDQEYFENAFN